MKKLTREIWYGMCGNWTSDWSKLVNEGTSPVPLCPECLAPGFVISSERWWKQVDEYERSGHPGYRKEVEAGENVCQKAWLNDLRLNDLKGQEVTLPTADEPAPIPNDRPAIQDLVILDVQERKREGILKYGTPLQGFNGRDPLVDAYQEALDLVQYLRQAIYERENFKESKQ